MNTTKVLMLLWDSGLHWYDCIPTGQISHSRFVTERTSWLFRCSIRGTFKTKSFWDVFWDAYGQDWNIYIHNIGSLNVKVFRVVFSKCLSSSVRKAWSQKAHNHRRHVQRVCEALLRSPVFKESCGYVPSVSVEPSTLSARVLCPHPPCCTTLLWAHKPLKASDWGWGAIRLKACSPNSHIKPLLP